MTIEPAVKIGVKQLHPPSFSKAAAFLEKEKIIENIIKGFRFLDSMDPNNMLWTFLKELGSKYVKKSLNSIELDVFVNAEENNNRRMEALAGCLNYLGYEDVHFFSLHWLETAKNDPLIYYIFNHLRLGFPVEDIRRLELASIFFQDERYDIGPVRFPPAFFVEDRLFRNRPTTGRQKG